MKNKLAEKTKGAQSEQAVLMKAFKYFDLNDNGTVEPDEFAKAIEKIGIQIPTKQVSGTFKFKLAPLDISAIQWVKCEARQNASAASTFLL